MNSLLIDKDNLTIDDVVAVSRDRVPVSVFQEGYGRVEKAMRLIARWVREEKVIYGITTGFGAMCNVTISAADTRALQKKILMSHAAGVGDPLPEDVVRAILAIRLHDLYMGYSACTNRTLGHLVTFLNRGVTPVIPAKGSVGASGDLAPTAHLGLVLIGLGEAIYRGERMSGSQVLEKVGLAPLVLEAGEGLALINGTQVRPHPGQIASARNMLRLTHNSQIILSHQGCSRVQDAYTLRCSPQIHGASKDAVIHAGKVVGIEINSTTTNPLIFTDTEEIRLGGNFHGQPIAMAADYLSMGIAELGNVSERRIERLVNPQLSGLPVFLIKNGGLNSGFMIAQYMAAALVSENKVLAHPACVDSIPTSANKEDHVSMGTIAIRQCREILDNVEHVLAVEMLCAAQAFDLLTEKQRLSAGEGTRVAYQVIREKIPFLDEDRVLATDITDMVSLIRSGVLLQAIENAVGVLKLTCPSFPKGGMCVIK